MEAPTHRRRFRFGRCFICFRGCSYLKTGLTGRSSMENAPGLTSTPSFQLLLWRSEGSAAGCKRVLSLDQNEEPTAAVTDDSNDIYILSEEQQPDTLSTGDRGKPSAWQTDSLPASLGGHESWAQVDPMDPEDVKDLHCGESVALAEERSENNSSNSDIVHVEREEAELMEESGDADGDAIEESMMSLLMTESDLAALRAEFGDPALHTQPPSTLVLPEEPVVMETPKSLSPEAEEVPPEPAETETPPEPDPAKPKPELEEEFPVLLYGGAVLVLFAAVTFGVILFRRR
uniref:Uncharacterized protein n=1 Tax=Poecilia mexicana TaxID=48701 RepID=A0A3B3Y2M2_9TELE